ncbi:cytosine permease, partial [Pseudomonas sp. KHB2.9]
MNTPPNRSAAPPSTTLKIETRSIDYVPRNERHGKVWHQAPFWFTGNFVLTTLVTGFTGAALGLSLVYAILAIVIGVCLGT